MATVNLGRVGLVLKGEWNSATQYTALDVVSHDGNAWAAKQNSTNVEPTTANSDFWQLFSNNADLVATVQGLKESAESSAAAAALSAQKAEEESELGANAMQGIAPVFGPAEAYSAGDYVWYRGILYRFTETHSAGEWIGTDAEETNVGTEIADLKSAITEFVTTGVINVFDKYSQRQQRILNNGNLGNNLSYRTCFVPVGDFLEFNEAQLYTGSLTGYLNIAYWSSETTIDSTTFISAERQTHSGSTPNVFTELNIPQNAKIIGFCSLINADYDINYYANITVKTYGNKIIEMDNAIANVEKAVSSPDDATIVYAGPKVNLSPYKFGFKKIGNYTKPDSLSSYGTPQGFCIHGDKILQLFKGGAYAVYDLVTFTGTALAYGIFSEYDSSKHCNSCFFGNQYAENDQFPLVYITQESGICDVYRIKQDYTTEKIQTISIDQTDYASQGYHQIYNAPNYFKFGNYIGTFGAIYRTNGSAEEHDAVNRYIVHLFGFPSQSQQTVAFTASDIMREIVLPYDVFYMQGCTEYNGMLIHVFGNGGRTTYGTKPANNTIKLYDLNAGNEINGLDIYKGIGSDAEPESAGVYDGHIVTNYTSNGYYAYYRIDL